MKKLVSLLLLGALAVSAFTGCGEKEIIDQNNNEVNGKFTEYLVAEKVGYANTDKFEVSNAGICYEVDGMYGVAELNGANETGPIFEVVRTIGNYFQVWTKAPKSQDDIEGWNSSKLIDASGRTVVPEGYAYFYPENERYITVAAMGEKSYSKDDCLLVASDNFFIVMDDEPSALSKDWMTFKGTWYVWDTVKEQVVPGISGTKETMIVAKGSILNYKTPEGKYVYVDADGELVTDMKELFDDGSFSVEGRTGVVYDKDGEVLFEYDLSGFVPTNGRNGYYVASRYADGASKYVVMDSTGKVISSEFDDFITLYGEIFMSGNKIYNLEGKNIISGTYSSVWPEKVFKRYYMLHNEGYYTLIDKNGTVYFNGPYDDNHSISDSDFLASEKKDDGKRYYYSYKDQDYTIQGNSFAPWIVETHGANNVYDLVDTMTGEKLLEGYSRYKSVAKSDQVYYVYAIYNGGADIFLIESSALMKPITDKKSDLFDELTKAFEAEGINVTVNRETGEIALDSSILFGGDSSELTADGKAFLNKFIKAYVAVVGTEKYESFILKTMVEGHTAPVSGGTYESGLQLSVDRATNVMNYCLSPESGVDTAALADKLEAVGYSNSKPIYGENGEPDLAASRRVSFRFIVNVEE